MILGFEHQCDCYQDLTNEEEDKLLDAFFDKDGAPIAKRVSHAITCIKELDEDKNDATGYSWYLYIYYVEIIVFMV